MSKTKIWMMALVATIAMTVIGCNTKEDPRQNIYNTWLIEEAVMNGDQVAQEATRQTNTLEFTEKGVIKLTEGSDEIQGSFRVNETATSMTTVMDGSTDTFMISELTDRTMTLSQGELKMRLKVKE